MADLDQVHMYVCMMIELKDYALTDRTRAVFELCKVALRQAVQFVPHVTDVVNMYLSVVDPHQLPIELSKTQYTDQYVKHINELLTEILLAETPEELIHRFEELAV